MAQDKTRPLFSRPPACRNGWARGGRREGKITLVRTGSRHGDEMGFLPTAALAPMPEPLRWLVLALVALVLLPYLLGPVLVRFTQKSRAHPTILTFDPDERPAPATVQEFLDECEAALWSCDFEVLTHAALPDLVPNVKAIFVLLSRQASNDDAIAVALFGEGAGGGVRKFYVEFSTSWLDGTVINTNNTPDESAYRPLPHKKMLQFDFVKDPAELWRVHERATRELASGPKKPSPTRQTAVERLREGMLKENTDQVAVGWLWLDETPGFFRPTWKGACLMTWKLCWPVSAMRRAARRGRARGMLREWGIEDVG